MKCNNNDRCENHKRREKEIFTVKFCSYVKNIELMFIKVFHESENGKEIKEDMPKHTRREGPEIFLQTVTANNILIKRHKLLSSDPDNKTEVELAFETMSRSSSSKPLKTWEDACDILRLNQITSAGHKR